MHVESFLILFGIASAVALGARWLRLPYTVALVVVGLALGQVHLIQAPELTRELLFSIILPGLIFEAAFHLDAHKFWADRVTINAMATPGLVLGMLITAGILVPVANALAFVSGFTFLHGLVFAAIIGATDPIAVVALFKTLGAPKRLQVIVEGESLLNDGTGVVIFSIAVAAATGERFTLGQAAFDFLRVSGLGALVGMMVGYAMGHVIRRIDDAMIELTLTVITAYGSFVVAERLGGSGVIATVAAGMLSGTYSVRGDMSPTTRVAVETFWEYLAFALNSIVFLLLGFEVQLSSLLASWKPILAAYVAATVARAAVVYLTAALLRPTRARMPWTWAAVVSWSGLRGALSMVLVLGLPVGFPQRELLVNMTFGFVLLTILLQGLSMRPLLRKLGLVGPHDGEDATYEVERGRVLAASAALAELLGVANESHAPGAVVDRLRSEYTARLEKAQAKLRRLYERSPDLQQGAERSLRRRMLVAERDAILRAGGSGAVGLEVQQRLLIDVDARLQLLEESGVPEAPSPLDPGTKPKA